MGGKYTVSVGVEEVSINHLNWQRNLKRKNGEKCHKSMHDEIQLLPIMHKSQYQSICIDL